MSRSRCTPLLVLNAQCSFIAPSFLGSFRITELIVVDSTSGSSAFIEASCLRSTRITTNTQAVPVISSKHGISKLHSQGDVYNNNCCNAIRSSLACSPYLSNTAPLQAISQLFINGENISNGKNDKFVINRDNGQHRNRQNGEIGNAIPNFVRFRPAHH